MKLLVTGAAGRIGFEVAKELLAHKYQVRALDMAPISKELCDLGAEATYADIADPLQMLRAIEGCAGLIHIAGIPGPIANAARLLDANIKGTYNVLEAAHAVGIQRAIITSSVAALGFSFPLHTFAPDYLPIDTAHPQKPQDMYGLSKQANEIAADLFTRRQGMTTIVIRPTASFDLYRGAQSGWLQRRLDSGTQKYHNDLWGYIHVPELARLYRLAWEAPLEPGCHIFYGAVNDVLARLTPCELIERFLPDLLPYADKVKGGFYDMAPAREKLGFEAKLTWRDVLEEGKKE